ncbi:MAG: excinuclease ABC subunit UvrA [Coriobacteriaceae bacterium]|nr:excinuclease ABC subunit UvrA [Coriobacteriaceae bacterium]
MRDHVEIRGARVHNLKNIDVDVPLGQIVGIAGVSGSGKSSLALGVLYSEGSRRYLESLSAYTRRRLTQAADAKVDEVRFIPPALALHQRPSVPGPRSTFGTMTELLNTLRLLYSRAGSHACPRCGAHAKPSLAVAAEEELVCPACGTRFYGAGAEELAFNSQGACPTCQGTGIVRTVDRASLVPDESKSIDEGAVLPWGTLMWDLMKQVAREMGVRTDVPFRELTEKERDIVFDGPAEKRHILYKAKKGNDFAELDFTYYNAVYTVENALAKVKDEKGLKRVERFLSERVCPDCHGSRLSPKARSVLLAGKSLDVVLGWPLSRLDAWVRHLPDKLPDEVAPLAEHIAQEFRRTSARLLELGLGYLSLDRAGSTLSTGERQRVQLARAVRNRTTGALYVLDEPSIGLHPSNVDGLLNVMRDLVDDGNSVVLVDHDTRLLAACDHLIEMGPAAGTSGGSIIAQGSVGRVRASKRSRIAPYLGAAPKRMRPRIADEELFCQGTIELDTARIHTVRPLHVRIPRGRLVAVTGPSGSGKTTLVLESLVPAMNARAANDAMPAHVLRVDNAGITRAELIDASPIGANVRSTVATYSGIHDDLRRAFAKDPAVRASGRKAGDFSYNTGRLRCPTCEGTGTISLDVQFLPDMEIECPDCHGTRYQNEAAALRTDFGAGAVSMPELMDASVEEARRLTPGLKNVQRKLGVLEELGLGYLTLGEATPALSGGEAQRLKLASEMGKLQKTTLFVFDEPSIGLHPLDVRVLLEVLDHLVNAGATVVVIEHDLDMIANADYVIDMGPKGGDEGGRICCTGTPESIAHNSASPTGAYLS